MRICRSLSLFVLAWFGPGKGTIDSWNSNDLASRLNSDDKHIQEVPTDPLVRTMHAHWPLLFPYFTKPQSAQPRYQILVQRFRHPTAFLQRAQTLVQRVVVPLARLSYSWRRLFQFSAEPFRAWRAMSPYSWCPLNPLLPLFAPSKRMFRAGRHGQGYHETELMILFLWRYCYEVALSIFRYMARDERNALGYEPVIRIRRFFPFSGA